jgi:hypothetical protein
MQGMSAKRFWDAWINTPEGGIGLLLTTEPGKVAFAFADAYCAQETARLERKWVEIANKNALEREEFAEQLRISEVETARLREALRHAQSTVGFFASVIKSGERWSATCQEALDKVSSAAAPTKKTDSPK